MERLARERLYSRLNSVYLARVQRDERVLAASNHDVLAALATEAMDAGIFPSRKVAVDSLDEKYDIIEVPFMLVGPDPETGLDVYLDSKGKLHLCHLVSGMDEDIVDFTAFESGVPSNEHYINFTKMAIRCFMSELMDGPKPTPSRPSA